MDTTEGHGDVIAILNMINAESSVCCSNLGQLEPCSQEDSQSSIELEEEYADSPITAQLSEKVIIVLMMECTQFRS